MSGALQAVFQNLRSFVQAPPSVIGQSYGGGFYAGQISTAGTGIADYYLVIGPVASAENTSIKWKTSSTSTAGTSSVINGPANTTAMNDASHPAAQFCIAVSAGGFSDWYMPAKNELEVCYYNLKPTTTSNQITSGINANSVPIRAAPYTSGTPAQTSAADFQSTGTEAFGTTYYWSSTEQSSPYAWRQTFYNGFQSAAGKTYNSRVRAVRRVAV